MEQELEDLEQLRKKGQREISRGNRNLTAVLTWTPEAEKAFIELKQTLAQAEALSLPDYTLPFHLDVSEQDGYMHSILYQKQKGERRVLH